MKTFLDIDKRKTISNVKEYFKKDYPRLRARSQMDISNLQSPTFNIVPREIVSYNSQENNIMSGIQSKELVQATYKAINELPELYKTILKNVYLLDQSNAIAMELTGYGKSQYAVYKNKALLYFAQAFQDIYNLNEYKRH